VNTLGRFLFWLDVKILWILTLGKSRPGETISAAGWSLRLDGKWQGFADVAIIDWLARLVGDGPEHCRRAYVWQINLYKTKD